MSVIPSFIFFAQIPLTFPVLSYQLFPAYPIKPRKPTAIIPLQYVHV